MAILEGINGFAINTFQNCRFFQIVPARVLQLQKKEMT